MDRLRWDNIARAAAVVAVIALVVAWPHLKGAPPSLPPAAAQPVSIEDPALPAAPEEPAPEPRPRPKPRHRRAAPRHRASRAERERMRSVPAAPVRQAAAPAAPPAQPRAPQPPPAPSASDLAAHEFAVP
jgi:pyruvate dehydrogenase E2 component (dihydrolipoyllysine-residue acetyltransferase)